MKTTMMTRNPSHSKPFPLKTELLTIAKKIKYLKSMRKIFPFGCVPTLCELQKEYRSKHVAYSLLKGRRPQEIEPLVQSKHLADLNELEVGHFLLKLTEKIDDQKVLCTQDKCHSLKES